MEKYLQMYVHTQLSVHMAVSLLSQLKGPISNETLIPTGTSNAWILASDISHQYQELELLGEIAASRSRAAGRKWDKSGVFHNTRKEGNTWKTKHQTHTDGNILKEPSQKLWWQKCEQFQPWNNTQLIASTRTKKFFISKDNTGCCLLTGVTNKFFSRDFDTGQTQNKTKHQTQRALLDTVPNIDPKNKIIQKC